MMIGTLVLDPVLSTYAGIFYGPVSMRDSDGTKKIDIFTDTGRLALFNASETLQLALAGDSGTGGNMHFYNESGANTVRIDGDDADGGGEIEVVNATGKTTTLLDGDSAGSGTIELSESAGLKTISIMAAESAGDGAGNL